MNNWCFRLCVYVYASIKHSHKAVSCREKHAPRASPFSQDLPFLQLLLLNSCSQKGQKLHVYSLLYSPVLGESPLLVRQCDVLSQPVSGPADPSNLEISTSQPFPLFFTASLCSILCTGPVLGTPLCKQILSLK